MRRAVAVLALLTLASPGLAQTDAERSQALRDAAEALRGAIETLEGAATALEGTGGDQASAQAGASAGTEAAAGNTDASSEAGAPAESGAAGAAEGQPEIEETGQVTFLDPLDNTPLEIPAEDVTAAVEHFHATAENPYTGDEAAIADGEKIYGQLCAACHLKDGTGRIGPNLVDDNTKYPRTDTVKGMFEIIYAGGAGAMQPFHNRISQDEILRVIAFLDALGAE